MTERIVVSDPGAWDDFVLGNGGHPLQLWGWGELKSRHRWTAERVLVHEDGALLGGASILFRRLPGGVGRLAYIPRGPVVASDDPAGRDTEAWGRAERTLAASLAEHVRATARGTVALMIEPDAERFDAGPGWRASPEHVLPARTLILDLSRTEDELMSAMAKKTRQYVRKSAGEDLEIREVTTLPQLEACLAVYRQTADRADFGLHEHSYYVDAFELLGPRRRVWASYSGDEPVAFLWLGVSAATAFELYGGMNAEGQRLRANYALKWHAIRAMREEGVRRYDFGGLINDGVTTFKKGFAAHEDLLAGSLDRPLSWRYAVYARALPLGKRVLRAVARRRRGGGSAAGDEA